MIPIQDLRVGNYAYDNFDAHNPRQIVKLTLEDFAAMANGCNAYEPIKLTPEILTERCGFERVKTEYCDNWQLHDNCSVSLSENGIWVYSNDRSDANCYKLQAFEYLHDLQNLFYFLNDKTELPISL